MSAADARRTAIFFEGEKVIVYLQSNAGFKSHISSMLHTIPNQTSAWEPSMYPNTWHRAPDLRASINLINSSGLTHIANIRYIIRPVAMQMPGRFGPCTAVHD
jgi:hypothetical protein